MNDVIELIPEAYGHKLACCRSPETKNSLLHAIMMAYSETYVASDEVSRQTQLMEEREDLTAAVQMDDWIRYSPETAQSIKTHANLLIAAVYRYIDTGRVINVSDVVRRFIDNLSTQINDHISAYKFIRSQITLELARAGLDVHFQAPSQKSAVGSNAPWSMMLQIMNSITEFAREMKRVLKSSILGDQDPKEIGEAERRKIKTLGELTVKFYTDIIYASILLAFDNFCQRMRNGETTFDETYVPLLASVLNINIMVLVYREDSDTPYHRIDKSQYISTRHTVVLLRRPSLQHAFVYDMVGIIDNDENRMRGIFTNMDSFVKQVV